MTRRQLTRQSRTLSTRRCVLTAARPCISTRLMLLGLCAPAQKKALKEAEAKKEAEAEAKLAKAEAQKAELAEKKKAIAAAAKEKKEAEALAAAEVREPCPTAARALGTPLTPGSDRACIRPRRQRRAAPPRHPPPRRRPPRTPTSKRWTPVRSASPRGRLRVTTGQSSSASTEILPFQRAGGQ